MGYYAMYDGLLDEDLGEHVEGFSSSTIVAFADDIAVLATERNTSMLEQAINKAFAVVSNWIETNSLKLKTEAIVMTNKKAYNQPLFMINGVYLTIKEELRYLVRVLSKNLGFKRYLETASHKAGIKQAQALWH